MLISLTSRTSPKKKYNEIPIKLIEEKRTKRRHSGISKNAAFARLVM